MMRLFVTGAAGGLATGLRPFLRTMFDLTLVDIAPIDALHPGERAVQMDLGDRDGLQAAMQGCDAVLHLAAVHGLTISFEQTLDVNYRALIGLMDGAQECGIKRVIFASSNHGWGFYPRSDAPLTDLAPPRPDGWYAISKIWAEAVMAYYADTRAMATTSLRIGNCGPDVPDERRLHMWISYRDLARLIALCLARTTPGHAAFFACGDCPDPFFDTSAARAMGFVPLDRPGDHVTHPDIATRGPEPGIAGRLIGGHFARANLLVDPATGGRDDA